MRNSEHSRSWLSSSAFTMIISSILIFSSRILRAQYKLKDDIKSFNTSCCPKFSFNSVEKSIAVLRMKSDD